MRFRHSDLVAFLLGFLVVAFAAPLHAQTVQHFTRAQIAAQCGATWDQRIGLNATDTVATVNAYSFTFTIDGSASSSPIAATCTGAAAPFQCSGTYTVPVAGQTVGTHTMVVTATDPTNQASPGFTTTYVVDQDPIGPPPAPSNWRFILGIIGGVVAAIIAVLAHHG